MKWRGKNLPADMRQRMMYLGKSQAGRSVLLECKMKGRARQGTKLERVATLFLKDFYALSFSVT